MTNKQIVLAKLFSAQFLMAVLFTSTYCLIMLGCTYAMIKGKVGTETYIALLATFALIVREIADAYFKRNRKKEEQEDEKGTGDVGVSGVVGG
jgi:hypothetical protein